MTSTGKLPDPNDENRNKEKRLSRKRKSLEEHLAGGLLGRDRPTPSSRIQISTKPNRLEPKVQLELSEAIAIAIDIIASHEGISKDDVIRRAVGLYHLAHFYCKQGKEFGVVGFSEDGEPEIKEIIDL